jgi:DNA-directed RNA polymerase specialized sigma24 family protein
MRNLAAMHPNPQHHCRSSPPRPQSGAPKPSAVEGVQPRIEALIPRLRRYARALVRDPVAADDLVQDCLARALGKIHLWQERTDLRAWLVTILHNQYISLARRAALRLKATEYFGVPKFRTLFETTYLAGLRKAGVPEE